MWAKDALSGIKKGAPFSLSLTQIHFSRVASARGNKKNELSTVSFHAMLLYEYWLRIKIQLEVAIVFFK